MDVNMVKRVYVEKKKAYRDKERSLLAELRDYLGISGLESLRMAVRYDVEGISEKQFQNALSTVFAEAPLDDYFLEKWEVPAQARMITVEYLPGQFDQRADSARQCLELLSDFGEGDTVSEKTGDINQVLVRCAVCYAFLGAITEEELEKISQYLINPVDSRRAASEKPDTLAESYPEAGDVPIIEGFSGLEENELRALYSSFSLAMTFQDFLHIQKYFHEEEKRDPTEAEIRVLDTYWSDHCRHTTFGTEITDVSFEDGYFRTPIETAYQSYLDIRQELYGGGADGKPVCLMDLALIAMKKLKAEGKLEDLEDSEENNACSIIVPVKLKDETGEHKEEWLLFFKNETHNHPTEIEPFGGAATCLGGAIRDPLSGRGYVYQAMRITGAGDPTLPLASTLKGKLPQIRLTRGAAQGYSSYGNQIGLATGFVEEVYHPGYIAKRMEIGAVLGAAKKDQVIRERPEAGDVVILLGGRTGRDGIGGATGASKAHNDLSLETCGAEVQKGNPPTERKLQRLFRNKEASLLIKRCNDFGAGGVAVAIGELSEGLLIELDKVPKKYMGLGGTELAISESQERMAVVVRREDAERFLALAHEENLEATLVAEVTGNGRLTMLFKGRKIVDISRAFLDTNGARQHTEVLISMP
ncbi:MAG: phosphoribosylformylglycinamidine synthase, partial [Lachnospiraceae bacterium]|nr:phosphoribosylformylglycinamidine synthase [Lachnospiraceae bacterium]